MEKDFSYLKALCSETGTFRKIDDDLPMDFDKLKIDIQKETENIDDGTFF